MEILDYITIAVFAAGIMFVGSLFSSTGKNMKSFFAGGGNVPWWISGLSLFMGFFSAGTFVVWGSIAYSMGFVAVTIQLTMAAAGFAVGLLIAPRWNKTGCLTAAEYITRRYGASTQKLYTYIFLFISIFTTGSFLYPIAKIIEVAAGIPLSSSILILGVFCMIYVSLGGLRAVVVTDVLQFIILFAAVIIVIPLAFGEVGGVPEFLARVPEGFFTLFAGEYNWVFIVAFMLYNLFFLGGNWAYVQRYTSVRTPRDAKKVGVLFGVLYTFSPILWMLPPMIYRVFEPGLSGLENENAYLLMCKQTMPAGMLGLMLGGMIFATASSLNATLNISAGVFTNDIFKRLRPAARRDDADESRPHLHARLRGAGHRRGAAHPQHGRHRQRRHQRGGTHRSAPLPAADLEPLLQEPERQGDPQHDRHQSDRQRRSQIHHTCGRRLLAQPGRRDAGRGALPRAAAGRL